ncbi:E3 ubiquitin ligase Rnf121-like [Sycon ciliatum]|uniref:E3 ubiquitin ligase Rnf121-like n=1 Tax=Sycon ciliatum TaxID=27933 RepID=UPI0020AA9C19|eukprot:scpid72339/ scgid21981/ RING finger protein 121
MAVTQPAGARTPFGHMAAVTVSHHQAEGSPTHAVASSVHAAIPGIVSSHHKEMSEMMRRRMLEMERRKKVQQMFEAEVAKHKGHELMHLEIVLTIVVVTLFVQLLAVCWRKRYPRSYKAFILVALWLTPLVTSVMAKSWKIAGFSVAIALVFAYVVFRATRKPLPLDTPRFVYKFFLIGHGITLGAIHIGYFLLIMCLVGAFPPAFFIYFLFVMVGGFYWSVVLRDLSVNCSEFMAANLGNTSALPTRQLDTSACFICRQALEVPSSPDDTSVEKTIALSCSHVFHEFCIRGWCIVGKKAICPYCKEVVDMRKLARTPWEISYLKHFEFVEMLRLFLVWFPVSWILIQAVIWFLHLE